MRSYLTSLIFMALAIWCLLQIPYLLPIIFAAFVVWLMFSNRK